MSASDILQESAIHSPVSVEKEAEKKKKKSKKKAKKEANMDLAAAITTGKATVRKQEKELAKLNGEQASLGTKKKKRRFVLGNFVSRYTKKKIPKRSMDHKTYIRIKEKELKRNLYEYFSRAYKMP